MNNRKTAVNFDNIGNFKSFTVFPKSEQKKEFSTMFEILKDAEKYDEAGEKEVCKSMLETLKNYIDSYDSEDESVKESNPPLRDTNIYMENGKRVIPKTKPHQRTLVD